jgi:hypothetical protein
MFAITRQPEGLSPSAMKFKDFWIYDLRTFHSFWKQLVQNKKQTFVGESPWEALMKAYRLHLFSPLEDLISFARDFHEHDSTPSANISEKNIRETFHIFSNLGLKKIEQLRRFSRDNLQQRFGPTWASFFEGVLQRDTPWKWKPYRAPETLVLAFEFEDFCTSADLLFQEISKELSSLAAAHPQFITSQLKIGFTLSQENELLQPHEKEILLGFHYEPLLQKDLKWMLELIKNRIFQIQFDHPLWKFQIELFPANPRRVQQLSLFKNQADELSWLSLCQKLADQSFYAFEPEPTYSYLPEACWRRANQSKSAHWPSHALVRPLIQEDPKPIAPPQGSLKFTERLSGFDECGKFFQRDYFFTRATRHWIWVFRNHTGEWYRQGILE